LDICLCHMSHPSQGALPNHWANDSLHHVSEGSMGLITLLHFIPLPSYTLLGFMPLRLRYPLSFMVLSTWQWPLVAGPCHCWFMWQLHAHDRVTLSTPECYLKLHWPSLIYWHLFWIGSGVWNANLAYFLGFNFAMLKQASFLNSSPDWKRAICGWPCLLL